MYMETGHQQLFYDGRMVLVPSFYHGSYRRFLLEVVIRLGKDLRNGWHKLQGKGSKTNRHKKAVEDGIGHAIKTGGRAGGAIQLDAAVKAALLQPDARELHSLSNALERFSEFPRAYALRAQGHALLGDELGIPWDGRPITDGGLVVTPMRFDRQSLSYAIQYASYIGMAADLAPGCTVYLNSRLIPLFERSFPAARYVSHDDMPERPCADGDRHISLERLPALFATSKEAIAGAHRPLLAHPDLVQAMRARYSDNGKPVIGIAWGSKNEKKDVPGFKAWNTLLADSPARFLSLQYGDVEGALSRLSAKSGAEVMSDSTVDQLSDMDQFAAQLAAVDAVVTISNTGAHLAGAMGCNMITLLDDRFHLTWPFFENRTPWYPGAELVRRNGRKWDDVMVQVRKRVHELVSA